MAHIPIQVDLPREACEVALGPYIEGASLRPASRAAIESAPGHALLGPAYRTVTGTVAELEDMLDYFRSTADALATLEDARAACEVAVDNLRLALRLAGPPPSS